MPSSTVKNVEQTKKLPQLGLNSMEKVSHWTNVEINININIETLVSSWASFEMLCFGICSATHSKCPTYGSRPTSWDVTCIRLSFMHSCSRADNGSVQHLDEAGLGPPAGAGAS